MNDQATLPGTRGPQPERKARLFWNGSKWAVSTPTPDGRGLVYQARRWRDALRYLNLVTRRRRKAQ